MLLEPDFNINSIYDIDIYELKQQGIEVLFFDLDSTLMKSKSGKFSFKTLQFLKDLADNFKLGIITNNSNYNYIQKAREQVNIPIFWRAKKPSAKNLLRACHEFGVEPYNCAMIGDRPLSDILAGVRAGMVTILVDSISKDEENFIVRFARFLERLFIRK